MCCTIFNLILTDLLTLQKGGITGLPIHRSHSVPTLNKDESITQLDSFVGVFRVIPTTPRVVKGTVVTTSNMVIKSDTGNFSINLSPKN